MAFSLAAVTMASSSADAFGLGSLVGGSSASSQSSVTPEIIVKEYALGSKSVLAGHQNMLTALGFKEKATAALLVKKVTGDPNTSADDENISFITDSAKLIQEKLNDKDLNLTVHG